MLSDVEIAKLSGWRFLAFLAAQFVIGPIVYYSPKVLFRGVYWKMLEAEANAKFYREIAERQHWELIALRGPRTSFDVEQLPGTQGGSDRG